MNLAESSIGGYSYGFSFKPFEEFSYFFGDLRALRRHDVGSCNSSCACSVGTWLI